MKGRTIREGAEKTISYRTDARTVVFVRFIPIFATDSGSGVSSSSLIAIEVLEKTVDGVQVP